MKNILSPKEYQAKVMKKSPKSKLFKNSVKAFLFGGIICTLGQIILNFFTGMGLDKEPASSWTSVTLIFSGILLTGLDVYHKIAKQAGAGTLVPITGFANAMSSPAIEARTEGYVLGVGVKLFSIAGPVIAYGIGASFFAGLIIYFFGL